MENVKEVAPVVAGVAKGAAAGAKAGAKGAKAGTKAAKTGAKAAKKGMSTAERMAKGFDKNKDLIKAKKVYQIQISQNPEL